jgi:hypothetical protein
MKSNKIICHCHHSCGGMIEVDKVQSKNGRMVTVLRINIRPDLRKPLRYGLFWLTKTSARKLAKLLIDNEEGSK